MKKYLYSCMFLFICATLNSCHIYSSFQNAKVLPQKNIEITPEFSSVNYTNNSSLSNVSNNTGFQIGYGISNRINLRLRYVYIHLSNYQLGYNYSSIEGKIRIIQDKLAFSLPVCLYYGRNVEFTESVNLQPNIIFTHTFSQNFEWSISPKLIIYVPSFDNLIALNTNVGISTNNSLYSFRPEIGIAYKIHSNSIFLYWGFGISLNVTKFSGIKK